LSKYQGGVLSRSVISVIVVVILVLVVVFLLQRV